MISWLLIMNFDKISEVKSTKLSIDGPSLALNLTAKETKVPMVTHIWNCRYLTADLHAFLKSDFWRVFHKRFATNRPNGLCYAGRPKLLGPQNTNPPQNFVKSPFRILGSSFDFGNGVFWGPRGWYIFLWIIYLIWKGTACFAR